MSKKKEKKTGAIDNIDGNNETAQLSYYLLIVLNDEKYFVPLSIISKIINPLEIFPLPDTLDFVAGVANFSGEIVPMVDLKKALKLPALGTGTGGKFIICMYRNIKVGFILDSVIDSREIDTNKIKTDTTRVLENDFISGEYIYQKEVIAMIDIAKFIDTYKAD
jgi:chemotaxis signal transduction protein